MRKLKGTLLTFLAQQSGQIQLLIVAPILTLSFLSLVVRTASSAVDSSLEKKKVTEQLKRRLSEVQNEQPILLEWRQISSHPKAPLIVKLLRPEKELTNPPLQKALKTPSSKQISTHSLIRQLLLPLQVSVKVGKKMTLSSILESEGVEKEETAGWLVAVKKQKALQKLAAGRMINLSFALTKEEDGRELRSISYELDKRSRLVLEKRTNGKIVARTETPPVSLVWKGIGGRISGSLYKSAIKAGVPRQLIDDIADMDWDIDLASDLRQGDTFKVIFEEFHIDGKPIDLGRLVAAEIYNRGKAYTLFSLPESRDLTGPMHDTGKSGALFLRYPLKFTKITSVFTDARLHPILERVRPHTGVDFAAPRGTPIRAIADGKVTFAGRESGYGIIIRIDHPGPYDSAYAHLDRIAAGVKGGKTVEKGQVIGFVGSTGLATGPHLHFEMYKNGAFVNPLTAKISTEDSFQRKKNPAFSAKKQQVLAQLSAMKVMDQPVVLSMAAPGQSNSGNVAEKEQENRLAMATSTHSPSLIPGLSSTSQKSVQKKSSVSKTSSRSKSGRSRVSSSKKSKSYRARR
jgi:murein DD-endopeptidase MepM/ murein hydrolase activator NlpD